MRMKNFDVYIWDRGMEYWGYDGIGIDCWLK